MKDRTNFVKLPRCILNDEEYHNIGSSALRLFIHLLELEHRLCNEKNYFYRTDKQLVKDTGLSIGTVKSAKDELKKYPRLISIKVEHIQMADNVKSTEQFTKYQILV